MDHYREHRTPPTSKGHGYGETTTTMQIAERTEVQTVLGSSAKPMVKTDGNASPEPVSVVGDVICDDFHLWPEKFLKTLEITG